LIAGADPGEGDRPPKTYESNLFHQDFVQFGKQHSRYKAIKTSIVLSQQRCIARYTYWLDPPWLIANWFHQNILTTKHIKNKLSATDY